MEYTEVYYFFFKVSNKVFILTLAKMFVHDNPDKSTKYELIYLIYSVT